MTIGQRLKELREESKMTQKDLALKLELEFPAVSKYETNRVPIPQDTIIKLAEIFRS